MTKLKIFHGFSSYAGIIKSAYIKTPNLSNESFQNQKAKIFEAGFGSLNIWELNFINSPVFDYFSCITNAVDTQIKWGKENGSDCKGLDQKNTLRKIVIDQVIAFQPDILFAHDVNIFQEIIEEIKIKVKSIKIVFGWDGVLLHDLKRFKNYDLILSPVPETVNFYIKNKKKAYLFPFGFNPSVLCRIGDQKKLYDISFIGQLSPTGKHSERFEFIKDISKNLDLSLWTPSFGYNSSSLFYYLQLRRVLKLEFKSVYDIWNLRKFYLGSVFGLEMFEKIAQSKIVFNKHINHVGKAAANIRLFEVTGAGSCLLTDHKDNLSDYFDIDNEIVTYKSKEELISKAKYLLLNENERKKIAKAGQDRTLKDHNYSARFDQFSNYLLSII